MQRRLAKNALFAALLGVASACIATAPPFRPATVEHGKLHQIGGLWVLELDGSPEQRGQAAGLLVGEQVRWLLPRYLKQVAGVDRPTAVQRRALAALTAKIPAAHLAQLRALSRAAGVDADTLLAANLAPEMAARLACSCLATAPAASSDGKVRLARNLDWSGGDLLADVAVLVIESAEPHRLASFTWPGLVGVVTGMNDAGLSVADLMAFPGGRVHVQPGVPVLFAVRSMLEQADSVDSALHWLEVAARTLPQNYALADAAGVRVVETGPTRFRVRENQAGRTGITNFWDEDKGGQTDGRYDSMMGYREGDKLDSAHLQRMLERVALGRLNVQAVVLEPEARVAFVARGKPPVAAGTWTRIDLAPWLAGAGK